MPRPPKRPSAARSESAPPPARRRLRIQKVLAAQGHGSRREIEAWIAAGRVTVNGSVAQPGQAVGPRDEIRLDGRRLRVDWTETATPAGLAYHRPAHERLRAGAAAGARVSLERLPKPPGGRWIPVSPLGVGEGGLEIFVNDGRLAAALMQGSERLSSEFSVRVRGDFDASRIGELMAAASADSECAGTLREIEPAGGEAANRWARVVTSGMRPRDIKRVFERCGLEVNRVLRTRLGPVAMERALSRGRSRRLTAGELAALQEAAGLPAGARPRRPAPAQGRTGRLDLSHGPAGRRKRVR